MTDKNEQEKEEVKQTAEDSGTGVQSSTTPMLDKADEILKGNEAAADRIEAANAKTEELQVRGKLGGETAGASQVEEKKEPTPQEYVEGLRADGLI